MREAFRRAREQVLDLQLRYAHTLDEDRLEDWPALFADACTYQVIPRENHARGLKACLIDCRSRAMLMDRVVSLRDANIYNIHFDRHIMSAPLLDSVTEGSARARTQFMVTQSDQSGVTKLYAAGVYLDLVDTTKDEATFIERIVVLDSYGVLELLSTPL